MTQEEKIKKLILDSIEKEIEDRDIVIKRKTLENILYRTLKKWREEIKNDLLEIAEAGEYEDLRREVESYFVIKRAI